jgi:hypothetical protein
MLRRSSNYGRAAEITHGDGCAPSPWQQARSAQDHLVTKHACTSPATFPHRWSRNLWSGYRSCTSPWFSRRLSGHLRGEASSCEADYWILGLRPILVAWKSTDRSLWREAASGRPLPQRDALLFVNPGTGAV